MQEQVENSLREICKFAPSLRYELFYSLNTLLDPNSRIHPVWRKGTLKALRGKFDILLHGIGRSWEIWPVMAALMPGSLSNPSFEEVLESIQKIPTERFQEKILGGLVHNDAVVKSLLRNKLSLKTSLGRIPKTKREWISHIGLFPYDPKAPTIIALEKLLAEPNRFRAIVLEILEIYWKKSFRTTWERLQSQLRRSLEARERLFHSCSFAEFSKQALLRIEVDERKGEIRAIRGGYRLKFRDIEACYFLPSAFNDRRFWSAFNSDDADVDTDDDDNNDDDDSEKDDDRKATVVYFPFFDPAITLDLHIAGDAPNTTDPALDPALIFRALGDSTRFAIATILARAPTSSVDLARTLSVSKPTISHHVHLLREAGLLEEAYLNGSVELKLRRSVIEQLSDLTIAKLFEAAKAIPIKRTRVGRR